MTTIKIQNWKNYKTKISLKAIVEFTYNGVRGIELPAIYIDGSLNYTVTDGIYTSVEIPHKIKKGYYVVFDETVHEVSELQMRVISDLMETKMTIQQAWEKTEKLAKDGHTSLRNVLKDKDRQKNWKYKSEIQTGL